MTKNNKSFLYILIFYLFLMINSYWVWDFQIIYTRSFLDEISGIITYLSILFCIGISVLFWRCNRKHKIATILVSVIFIITIFLSGRESSIDTYFASYQQQIVVGDFKPLAQKIKLYFSENQEYPEISKMYDDFNNIERPDEVSFKTIGQGDVVLIYRPTVGLWYGFPDIEEITYNSQNQKSTITLQESFKSFQRQELFEWLIFFWGGLILISIPVVQVAKEFGRAKVAIMFVYSLLVCVPFLLFCVLLVYHIP